MPASLSLAETGLCPSGAEPALLDELALWCRERGASLTPIRRRALALLRAHPGGLKAYELLALMQAEQPNASPPTVYRALDFLIEQGLAHKIGRMNLFVACAQAAHRQPSLFLICPSCNRVTELQQAGALEALAQALAAEGHELDQPEVEISAICPACRGKCKGPAGPARED